MMRRTVIAPTLFALALGLMSGNDAKAQSSALECPETSGIGNSIVLMVDQTEIYDELDRGRFQDGAIQLLQSLQPRDKIEIFEITDSPGQAKPVFEGCMPGCTEEEIANESIWDRNCTSIRVNAAQRDFNNALVGSLRQMLGRQTSADGSEILQSLFFLSLSARVEPIDHLVIFSDMLEYSNFNRSLSRFGTDGKQIGIVLNRAKERANPNQAFAGTQVVVFGAGKRLGLEDIRKRPDNQRVNLEISSEVFSNFETFWRRYFDELGGTRDVIFTPNYIAPDTRN